MSEEENNWLDDAFDDEKNRAEQSSMAGSSKLAVGVGCFAAVVLLVAALVLGASLLGAIAKV